ncbi:MAG: hypothetical protein JST93_25060 [Acidobacteria bacterium]|nr:hypothetical protein [Acidobacteriota bacterium]
MSKLLLICPANDEDARIAASWAQTAVESAESEVEWERLSGPCLTRPRFEEAMSAKGILLYYGHGDWSRLVGEEDLLDCDNVRLTAGMTVCAIACRSARELGLEATTRAGTQSYLGFSQDVVFVEPDPEGIFRRTFAAAAERLLAGQGIEAAALALRVGIDRILDYFTLEGRHDPNAAMGRACALWLRRYLVLHQG